MDVMGVVTDVMKPTITQSGEFTVVFTIVDTEMLREFSLDTGVKVRFFRKRENELPPVRDVGDVVLLRSIKVIAGLVLSVFAVVSSLLDRPLE